MSWTPEQSAAWAAEAAVRLTRKTIEEGLRCDGRWVFEIGAEPEEGQAIGNVIYLTVALANHLATIYLHGAGSELAALQRLDDLSARMNWTGGATE